MVNEPEIGAAAEHARLGEAARRLEPTAVRDKPRGASLKTQADVDEYLEELRARIMGHLNEGRPVVL